MKLKVFSVRDSASLSFGTPIFLVSAGQATRSFIDQVNADEKDNPLFNHSSDFCLFELGEFDTETGKFSGEEPVQVVRGQDVRRSS